MIDEFVSPGSLPYYLDLIVLVLARGSDFFSTWVATPNLVLEANPLAKRLGWKGGIALNSVLCLVFAAWPLPALVISTTSFLVAARNFQFAWLMRSLGEEAYRMWMVARVRETPLPLYLLCLIAQTVLIGGIGLVLVLFSHLLLIPFAIGMGMVTYAVAVTVFTLLSLWRLR